MARPCSSENISCAASGPLGSPCDSTDDEQLRFYRNVDQGLHEDTNESAADAVNAYPSASVIQTALLVAGSWNLDAFIEPPDLRSNEDALSSSQNWAGYIDCGCLCPHVQVSSSQPRVYQELEACTRSQSSSSTDAHVNTLRVERICIVQAMASLCQHIGMTKDMLCVEKATSTFFRATGEIVNGTEADTAVKMVQTIFDTLKPDMRPTREQIIYQHAAFIDVLPFPTLRRNVIVGGDAVNLTEFYHDLVDGLVFWGGATDRKIATVEGGGDVSTGTPWDSRSWEARPWFLRKYWALLGGDEGELVRQSEWWRNVRGDNTDLWLEV